MQENELLQAIENALRRIHDEICRMPAIDQTVQISATQPWVVDYHERQHVFMWLPGNALTLSFEDYGSGVVNPQNWVNLGVPTGIRVFAPQITSGTTPIMLRFTDSIIP